MDQERDAIRVAALVQSVVQSVEPKPWAEEEQVPYEIAVV
jgi:hypothetical protein